MDQSRTGMTSPGGSPFTVSPLNRHVRASSGVSKKTQNLQAVAAAQRLAKVMAHKSGVDEHDEDDDVAIEYNTTGLGLSGGRARRPRPYVPFRQSVDNLPLPVRQPIEQPSPQSPPSATHTSLSIRTNEPLSSRSATSNTSPSPFPSSPDETPSSHPGPVVGRTTPVSASSTEQSLSARSPVVIAHSGHMRMAYNRPLMGVKAVHKIMSAAPGPRNQQTQGSRNIPEPKERNSRDASALQDEVDMLQEENDNLVKKLRRIEERCEEAEARTKQLQKQASLGDGISLEARLLNRKQISLRKEALKEESVALEQLQECESELRSLQSAVQRLVLTQEEMEEVVLKRCWLAWYWGLCVKYGIHPDIARDKHEYWSSWAPLPLEVVLSVGQKAKDDDQVTSDIDEREKVIRDVNHISGEHNAESMLLVEKGLKELASLKVEDAVLLEMAQKRKQNVLKSGFSDETRAPTELHKFRDPFELSSDEAEDVQFKLAWLTYFWRRAKNHGLEDEIAEDRLETWINQGSHTHTTNSHDAVDVERGMMELKKLGIDTILWEESRKYMDHDSL